MRGSGNDVAGAKMVTEEAEINHMPSRQTDRARAATLTFGRLIPSGEHERRKHQRGKNPRKSRAAVSLSVRVRPSVNSKLLIHGTREAIVVPYPDR